MIDRVFTYELQHSKLFKSAVNDCIAYSIEMNSAKATTVLSVTRRFGLENQVIRLSF